MINSCLITPKFLNEISSNEILIDKFYENFYLENKKIAKEVLILLDDNKINLKEEYKKILYKLSGKKHRLEIIIKDFLLRLNFEIVNLKEYKNSIDIKLNDIKDIEKPIELKVPYIEFPISENKLKDKLQSLARFGKKITLFDQNILDHITNFSNKGIADINEILKNIDDDKPCDNFKIKITEFKTNNYKACYKTSIRNILEIIFSGKIKKDLNLEILTCIKDTSQRIFDRKIRRLEEKYEKEEDKFKKEKIKILLENIKSQLFAENSGKHILLENCKNILTKCFTDPKWKNYKVNLKIVNDWDDNFEQFYRRGILVEGEMIRTVVCIGKGLNIYEIHKKKSPRLRQEKNYHLRLIDNPNEKKTYTIQTRFPDFNQKIRDFSVN